MENFGFSVSMCVYGGDNSTWFEEAVNSVLNQSVKPSEIVLVVDGPVPAELDSIISKFETDPFFTVVRLKENQGHGNARRIGLETCRYDLVALMDADDICTSDRFEKQLDCFKNNPELAIVGGCITEFIGTPDNKISRRVVPQTDAEIKEYLKKRCPMNQVTVMFRKECLQSVGGYIDWFCEEDYYLWIRMCLANMQFYNLQDDLVNVRVGEEMCQRRGGIKYFKSEAKLQRYMLDNDVIGKGLYISNVVKRLIVQVLLPNKIREFIFKKFAREKI